jgi:hypothetical protein
MRVTEDKNLQTIEQELRFIPRESQQIEGSSDTVDEINLSVVSALRALDEYRLSLGNTREEVTDGVRLAA